MKVATTLAMNFDIGALGRKCDARARALGRCRLRTMKSANSCRKGHKVSTLLWFRAACTPAIVKC